MEITQSSEVFVRLGFFVGVFMAMALLEGAFPRRTRQVSRVNRWPSNIAISLLNQGVIRLCLPATAVALAMLGERQGWGLFAQLTLAPWVEILAAVLLFDLVIYWQHRLYHVVPVLWRFHRMHHADTEFDVTTGIRFHPLSVLLSAAIKLGAVVLLGPAPLAVLIFEVLLNATSLFNHSNFAVSQSFDRALRLLVVTPDMHRVHHSSNPDETNRNFGFNFPWWDRMFRSYRAQPARGHQEMEVGLATFRQQPECRLDRMLTQPFRSGSEA
ncbi:MAG: sterol desaturase family protein [Pseudomonadales bacterium]